MMIRILVIISVIPTSDLVIYYENSSFFWTISGEMKISLHMGFRFQVSGFRPAFAFFS